jgi:hypothetical protein
MNATASKSLRFLVASIVFGALLAAVYVAHVRWFRVEVVLYSAIADALLAAALAGLALWRLRAFAAFNAFEKLQMLLAWGLLGYVFAISVPTVIDRSLSFYLLEKIQQRGGGLRLDRIDEVFTQEYVREHRLMSVRLTEQLASGTVVLDHGCIRLTARGDRLATFSRAFRRYLLPRRRVLLGRETDELLDPFRNGAAGEGDSCPAPGAQAGQY